MRLAIIFSILNVLNKIKSHLLQKPPTQTPTQTPTHTPIATHRTHVLFCSSFVKTIKMTHVRTTMHQ